MSENNPFPDGKLPPMPKMAIDELTAKEISQEQVDQSLQLLWDEWPDLVIGVAEGDFRPEVRGSEAFEQALNKVIRYFIKEAAPRVGGYDPYEANAGLMWELRRRIRRALNLPVTQQEIDAVLAGGGQVI